MDPLAGAASQPLHLEWTAEDGSRQRHALSNAELVIGRAAPAQLVITVPTISRQHARLYREGQQLCIEDLHSANGTFVNGRSIQREKLQPGDVIGLGRFEMRLLGPDSPAPAEPRRLEPSDADLMRLTTMMPAARGGTSELEKLSLLLELHVQANRTFSEAAAFQQILRSVLQVSQAERACVAVRDDEGGFRYAAGMELGGRLLAADSFQASRTVVRDVLGTGRARFETQGLGDDLQSAESIMAARLRAVACLPLIRHDAAGSPEILGVLYVDSTQPLHALSGLDRRILERLAHETTGVLEKVEMLAEVEEKKRLERELELAEQTQRALLPPRLPQVEGYRLQAHCQPTRHVGGDFYDFVTLGRERLVAVLADVSGKGVAASLLSSSVQGALQMLLRRGLPPAEVIGELNHYLCERSAPGQFVTLFLLWLDGEGRGGYVNAGHPPAFLHRRATGAVEPLVGGGMIVGVFESSRYAAQPLQLLPGDLLLVYSDGLTDAENPQQAMFGEARVRQLVARRGASGAEAVQTALLAEVQEHAGGASPTDDITLVLVERSALGTS